ncbi:hypothetical protein NDN08_006286 [Rhodosorus marinus]|uniref:CCR4-NOT transcription complex subunit 3 n=1 Tax=Rhodosorus marinus TaxID=101924 RepID=A0AAV8UKP3_9RHOD|nr:hypothetical protein NDN08_006286 [Rhodosorus marinus]
MANRKQQTEIDKVLKRVDEGVIVFEQIWDKVYSASTTSQKEKYEGDLKKEIKKLQRLRDSIKTWQGDSSIKDKSKLDSARKIIEEKMERFKICEKETKTKAFSKEGLAQDRTDPKEREKRGVREWIGDNITRLRDQCDEFEAEIESLTGRKNNKSGANNNRVDALREHTERHQFHITMLEKILRAVDNETISCQQANDLKESVDYYIDANQEEGFLEEEDMYDELDLDNVAVTSTSAPSKDGELMKEPERKPSLKLEGIGIPTSPPKVSRTATTPKAVPSPPPTKPGLMPPVQIQTAKSPPSAGAPTSAGLGGVRTEKAPSAQAAKLSPTPQISPGGRQPLLSNIVKGSSGTPSPAPMGPSGGGPDLPLTGNTLAMRGFLEGERDPFADKSELNLTSGLQRIGASSNLDVGEPQGGSGALQGDVYHSESELLRSSFSNAPLTQQAGGGQAFGLSGEEMSNQLAALDRAMRFFPESADTEIGNSLTRQYKPRNPTVVPTSYPVLPSQVFENVAIFQQFDVDTLFFIFYYQQGTYQQYLAARELKKKAWRFHKKYLTWFQRHEEPKVTTDDYEQGTYLYFDYALKDYETGWCQRIKTDFTFEYQYLEDELQ